jgi:ADP-ribose pyrophosphatase YjhB (NUDIX family)
MTQHRAHLIDLLTDYRRRFPGEAETVARIRALVDEHDDCMLRSCAPGHVTASAWILDANRERFLLTHHRKLERWLQVGGHVDGERPDRGCLREAVEESGIEGLRFVGPTLGDGSPAPFDLDVHAIPARRDEPAHEHHDFRYLLVAPLDAVARASERESHGVAWFGDEDAERLLGEESLARMWRKARAIRS